MLPKDYPNVNRLLTFIWVIFIVRGLFYISVLPLWEGLDEWAHYAVIQIVAERGHPLVARNERVSREIETSLELVPWVDGNVKQDSYWRLSDLDRAQREARLRTMPGEWQREPAVDGPLSYEAQQTPIYYWMFALVYKVIEKQSFLSRMWCLRFFGLIVASAVIPLGFFVAKRAFASNLQALGIVALIAATPELMLTVSHIGNDSLAVAIGSLLLLTLFQWKEQRTSLPRALTVGVVLGLALLTKAYFIALVPPIFIFMAIWAKRQRSYRQAVCLLASTLIISTWWYLSNWRLTHSISGEQIEVAGVTALMSHSTAMFKVNWLRVIDFALISHTWLGNWSFIVVRSWMYRPFALLAGLACIGLILRLIRKEEQLPSRLDLALLFSCYLSFLLALGYHSIGTFRVYQSGNVLAHYLVALTVAEAILLLAGLERMTPAALLHALIPGSMICLAALEFFGMHFYAIPYYTGFTAHMPSGHIPALKLQQLQGDGLLTMLGRMAINKPNFLNAHVIAVLWVLFLASTLGLIIIATQIAWARRSSAPVRSRPAKTSVRGPD